MGSVRARKESGLLFIDFRYLGQRCREQTLLADNPANRKRLEKVLAKVEADVEAGTFDYEKTFPGSRRSQGAQSKAVARASIEPAVANAPPLQNVAASAAAPSSPTLRVFADQWMRDHEVEWRRSHIKVLQSTIDGHLLPALGDREVASINKADILTLRTKLAELPGRGGKPGLSNKRINGILAPLRQMLNEAAEQYGFVSPVLNLKPLRVRKTDVEPFTLEETQTILRTVRADYRDYFVVRFFTGMRTGEAHGLKWKYVDFANRLILVRETFVLGEDEYTKTDSSQRDIQMSQVVHDALQRQHKATGKLSEYVFCNREGKPLDNKNFSDRVWYPLLRHLGLKQRRPYQMRHTAATLWLASGEAPEWIARQLGHSSTEMLFRVYSRYVPNLTRRDGSAIDRLLTSRLTGEGGPPSDAPKAPPGQPPPRHVPALAI
jgi:integrase